MCAGGRRFLIQLIQTIFVLDNDYWSGGGIATRGCIRPSHPPTDKATSKEKFAAPKSEVGQCRVVHGSQIILSPARMRVRVQIGNPTQPCTRRFLMFENIELATTVVELTLSFATLQRSSQWPQQCHRPAHRIHSMIGI
jgi:hypothetical protein